VGAAVNLDSEQSRGREGRSGKCRPVAASVSARAATPRRMPREPIAHGAVLAQQSETFRAWMSRLCDRATGNHGCGICPRKNERRIPNEHKHNNARCQFTCLSEAVSSYQQSLPRYLALGIRHPHLLLFEPQPRTDSWRTPHLRTLGPEMAPRHRRQLQVLPRTTRYPSDQLCSAPAVSLAPMAWSRDPNQRPAWYCLQTGSLPVPTHLCPILLSRRHVLRRRQSRSQKPLSPQTWRWLSPRRPVR